MIKIKRLIYSIKTVFCIILELMMQHGSGHYGFTNIITGKMQLLLSVIVSYTDDINLNEKPELWEHFYNLNNPASPINDRKGVRSYWFGSFLCLVEGRLKVGGLNREIYQSLSINTYGV